MPQEVRKIERGAEYNHDDHGVVRVTRIEERITWLEPALENTEYIVHYTTDLDSENPNEADCYESKHYDFRDSVIHHPPKKTLSEGAIESASDVAEKIGFNRD